MKINLKKIKGMDVFENGASLPCGKVRGVCFSKDGEVECLLVESQSIVPIAKKFNINSFQKLSEKGLFFKKGLTFSDYTKGRPDEITDKNISRVALPDGKSGVLKDVVFDFETGEITEFFVKKGRFQKPREILINKIKIKDNTIYIDSKGGD